MKRYVWVFVAILGIIFAVVFMLRGYLVSNTAVAIASCKSVQKNFSASCYTDLINETFKKEGLAKALTLVGDMSRADPSFDDLCHGDMHILGSKAYNIFSKTGTVDMTPDTSYCGYGFFHGFMIEMMAQTGSLAEARTFCDSVGTTLHSGAAVSNCYHGIGHGAADGSDPRAWGDPVAMVKPGIDMCNTVSKNLDVKLRESCYRGAFGSLEIMYANPKYKLPADKNPFAVCDLRVFSDQEKKSCYVGMGMRAAVVSKDDRTLAFKYALDTDSHYRALVVYSAALFSTGLYGMIDSVSELNSCLSIASEYRENCITGIAKGLALNGRPGREYDSAAVFCANSSFSREEQSMCVNEAVHTNTYTAAEEAAACSKFPPALRAGVCS